MKLKSLDFIVQNHLRSGNAAPSIGLVPVDGAEEYIDAFTSYLEGEHKNLMFAFDFYPYATAWVICHILRRNYGVGAKFNIYKTLKRELKLATFTLDARAILKKGFKDVCNKLNIEIEHFARQVDVYLALAGVSEGMIGHLAKIFLRQERYYGLPSIENTQELNEWEDSAVDYLTPGVLTPARAIELDDTGWHATLYTAIRNDEEFDAGHFGELFKAEIEAQHSASDYFSSGNRRLFERPKLIWDDSGLSLDVPNLDERLPMFLDSDTRPYRLASGQLFNLPLPWPRQLKWEIDGRSDKIDLLDGENSIAVFDCESGRLNKTVNFKKKHGFVTATEVMFVSRETFVINDENSYPIGEQAHCFQYNMNEGDCKLEYGDSTIDLILRRMKRIKIDNGILAKGSKFTLCGQDTVFNIDSGINKSGLLNLQFSGAGRSESMEIELNETGQEVLKLSTILELLNSSNDPPLECPFKLRMEMSRSFADDSAQRKAEYRAAFIVWPNAKLSENGMGIENVEAPDNLLLERSRHIVIDKENQVLLNRHGGYDKAKITFEIDQEFLEFTIPYPGVLCSHHALDGRVKHLTLGSQIILREEERYDKIVIRCPDREADLIVRGRHEPQPFRKSKLQNISYGMLLASSGNSRIELKPRSGNSLLLFQVAESTTPEEFKVRGNPESVQVELKVSNIVDTFQLTLEDEMGEQTNAYYSLGRMQVDEPPPDWLYAELSTSNPHLVKATVDLMQVPKGTYLAHISVRFEGRNTFERISNLKRENYAFAIVGRLDAEDDESTDFPDHVKLKIITKWLTSCYCQESWDQLFPTLKSSWTNLIKQLKQTSEGMKEILSICMTEPPEETPDGWIPKFQTLAHMPKLLSVKPERFSVFAASEAIGVEQLAIVADVESSRLRELEILSPAVVLAFANSRQADETGERLKGFDAPKFISQINNKDIDRDPSAGLYWRGRPILGPEHWRAAHLRFIDRLKQYNLFGDSIDDLDYRVSNWQTRLNKLMTSCHRFSNIKPPVPERMVMKKRKKVGKVAFIDEWAAATLCSFAKAARSGKVTEWVDEQAGRTDLSKDRIRESIALLIRLAPELFAFYMGVWQLSHR